MKIPWALGLWMGMWAWRSLPSRFQISSKSTGATNLCYLCNARQCDPWDGRASGCCVTSTGVTDQCLRKYSYVINLKIKRFAFKHSPCWCSTVLYPSTTHHRYLRQKGQKSSPLLQASSSPCDLLALILGARSLRETVKATDEIEDDAIRTVKMQMRGWIVVDIKDVFDLKAGTFNKEWMKKSVRDREGNEDFLGFLRIRWINFRWC